MKSYQDLYQELGEIYLDESKKTGDIHEIEIPLMEYINKLDKYEKAILADGLHCSEETDQILTKLVVDFESDKQFQRDVYSGKKADSMSVLMGKLAIFAVITLIFTIASKNLFVGMGVACCMYIPAYIAFKLPMSILLSTIITIVGCILLVDAMLKWDFVVYIAIGFTLINLGYSVFKVARAHQQEKNV